MGVVKLMARGLMREDGACWTAAGLSVAGKLGRLRGVFTVLRQSQQK
jgi:hypothetical protein